MSRGQDGRGKSRLRLLRVSVAELRPQWPLWLAVLVGILPSVGFHTLQPLLFRAVIDEAIIPRNAGRLLVLMGLLGGLIVLHLLGEIAREYFAARAAARLLARLRLRTFEHLQRLAQGILVRADLGGLMFQYTTDLSNLEAALTHAIPVSLRDSLTLLACGTLLFTIDSRLAAASVLLVFAVGVAPRLLGAAAQRASDRLQQDATGTAGP